MHRLRYSLCLMILLGSVASADPRIDTVVDVASQIPPGFPNYGLPPGGIMRITGDELGPEQEVTGFPAFPLPITIGGTSVRVDVGGTILDGLMISAQAQRVFAILPSDTPLGDGTLTVTFADQTSAAFPIRVTDSVGIFSLNGRGTGPALAINSRFEPITIYNPARPGEFLLIVVTANFPEVEQVSPAANLDRISKIMQGAPAAPASHQLWVGVRFFTAPDMFVERTGIAYGRLFPGVSYGIIQVPDLPGCWVPFTMGMTGGGSGDVWSNISTLSIASMSDSVCRDQSGIPFEKRVELSTLAPFNKLVFSRVYRGAKLWNQTGPPSQPLIGKFLFEEDTVKGQGWKDRMEFSQGCQVETFWGNSPPRRYAYMGLKDLGNVSIANNQTSSTLPKDSNNTYQFISSTTPFGGAGPITINASGAQSGEGFTATANFPSALPTQPFNVNIRPHPTPGTFTNREDLVFDFSNVPFQAGLRLRYQFGAIRTDLNAGAVATCISHDPLTARIPTYILNRIPTSVNAVANFIWEKEIYGDPMTLMGAPARVRMHDIRDVIVTQVTGINFENVIPALPEDGLLAAPPRSLRDAP